MVKEHEKKKKPFAPRIEIFSAFKQPFGTQGQTLTSKEVEKAAACCACTACTACR